MKTLKNIRNYGKTNNHLRKSIEICRELSEMYENACKSYEHNGFCQIIQKIYETLKHIRIYRKFIEVFANPKKVYENLSGSMYNIKTQIKVMRKLLKSV